MAKSGHRPLKRQETPADFWKSGSTMLSDNISVEASWFQSAFRKWARQDLRLWSRVQKLIASITVTTSWDATCCPTFDRSVAVTTGSYSRMALPHIRLPSLSPFCRRRTYISLNLRRGPPTARTSIQCIMLCGGQGPCNNEFIFDENLNPSMN